MSVGVALVLTACAATTGTSLAPASIAPTTSPTASPTSVASIPASTPSAAALPPVTAASTAPVVFSRNFPLVAIGGSRVMGQVQITDRNGSFVAGVSVAGLPPGTLHPIHIHAGSCANPYGGMHLTVLGLLWAGPAGVGSLTTGLAPVYVASGRYVIVYASTSRQVIVGCADLMSLS